MDGWMDGWIYLCGAEVKRSTESRNDRWRREERIREENNIVGESASMKRNETVVEVVCLKLSMRLLQKMKLN